MLQLLGTSVLQLHFISKIAGESKTGREESGGVRGEGGRERERERERVHTHTGERKRVRERERKSTRTRERESVRKHFGSSFYMFYPPPGPALCKLGLARSAVCSA